MSMPVGQTATQALQSMQSPRPSHGCPFLCGPAGLAAMRAVADEQRFVIDHGALDARPGAHVDADLLAGDAAEQVGGQREDAEEQIGDGRRGAGQQLAGERRRIAEIENERAARQPGRWPARTDASCLS